MRTITKAALAGAVVVLAGAGVGGALAATSQPHYSHPWCARIENTMDAHLTGAQFQDQLAGEGNHAAQLLTDAQTYATDYAILMGSSPGTTAVTFSQVGQDLGRVGYDLAAIDRACGVPASKAGKQNVG